MNKEAACSYEDLKKEGNSKFSEAKNDIKSSFDSTNENIKEAIAKVMEDFTQFLEEKKDDLAETATGYTSKVRKTIKDNPIYALAGALTAGAVIGALCRKG